MAESSEMLEQLLDDAGELDLPLDFLDTLISELGGPEEVAEMTGRRMRLVKQTSGSFMVKQRCAESTEVNSINGNQLKEISVSSFVISRGEDGFYAGTEAGGHYF